MSSNRILDGETEGLHLCFSKGNLDQSHLHLVLDDVLLKYYCNIFRLPQYTMCISMSAGSQHYIRVYFSIQVFNR